ncbi:DUF2155 domain-containing protein [Limibacillus halophilus]
MRGTLLSGICGLLGLCISLPASALTGEDFTVAGTGARLQALDKVTARVSVLEVQVGESVTYGSLKITLEACRKTPPTEEPESAAFLQIDDDPPDAEARQVYSGWMFASSPGLAALEHPVYDVWLLDCSTPSNTSGETSGSN